LLYAAYSPSGEIGALGYDPRFRLRLRVQEGERWRTVELPAALSDFAWMPDSRSILAAVGKPMKPSSLMVVDLDGELQSSIQPTDPLVIEETGMVVQPNGQAAIVAAVDQRARRAGTDLFRIDLEDGSVRRLTETPSLREEYPVLNDSIVYYSAASIDRSGSSIFRSPTTDGEAELISPAEYWFDRPAVGAGSSTVYASGFPLSSPLSWEVYRRVETTDPTPFTGIEGPLRWVTISPDGREFTATEVAGPGEPGWLVTMPITDE
jgi:hypothetical protein